MIRALDENRSVAFYEAAFDLRVADPLGFTNFTLVYMSNAECAFELELTVNKDRTEPYDLGDDYGHLAVPVEDLDTTHAQFKVAGLRGVSEALCMRLSPCRFDGSFIEPFWV